MKYLLSLDETATFSYAQTPDSSIGNAGIVARIDGVIMNERNLGEEFSIEVRSVDGIREMRLVAMYANFEPLSSLVAPWTAAGAHPFNRIAEKMTSLDVMVPKAELATIADLDESLSLCESAYEGHSAKDMAECLPRSNPICLAGKVARGNGGHNLAHTLTHDFNCTKRGLFELHQLYRRSMLKTLDDSRSDPKWKKAAGRAGFDFEQDWISEEAPISKWDGVTVMDGLLATDFELKIDIEQPDHVFGLER